MHRLFAASAAAVLAAIAPASAQEKWPERQVNVIVPFTAGGTTDMFGRIFAQHMQAKFGPPFIVENRAGAGGNIGTSAVAKAAPDGYTILIGTVSTHAINPFLYTRLPHDTEKDFQPVSLIARLPNILVVHPRIPAKTLPELIDYVKANPGKLSYGSSGAGTSTHLAAELFQITDRHQDDARALPQLGRRHELDRRRPHRPHLRQHDARLAAGAGRRPCAPSR